MPLTADRQVDRYLDRRLRSFQVKASTTIFKGSLVGLDSNGYARPLVAGDPFVGFAFENLDNSAGADGDESLRCDTTGDFDYALAGATLANIGDAVYASADDTLTLTATSNSFVGHLVDVPSTGVIILRLREFGTAP